MRTPGLAHAVGCTLLLAVVGAGQAEPLTLVQDGQPTAAIVLAAEPTRAAQFAAAELQYHLRKMTGATVPMVTDPRGGERRHPGAGPDQ